MALPDTTPKADDSAANTIDSAAAPSDVQGYCVKCKSSRNMTEVQIVNTKNGRKAAKGKCPVCGTTVMKFLPK